MADNNKRSTKEIVRLKKRFEALYVNELLSQKEAAKLCDISTVTACKWVKDFGLKEKRKLTLTKATKGRDKDSANAFVMNTKRKLPHLFPTVLEAFNLFIKPY